MSFVWQLANKEALGQQTVPSITPPKDLMPLKFGLQGQSFNKTSHQLKDGKGGVVVNRPFSSPTYLVESRPNP